jgi:prolyl oligopeptidase
MTPPSTRRSDRVDIVHGVEVPDPYRWLEDADDPAVMAWVEHQNVFTRDMLDDRPDHGRWHERVLHLLELPVVLAAQVRGDVIVTLERAASAPQAVLAARSAVDPAGRPTVLADPSADTDDAAAAVDWFSMSRDGTLVAYGVSEGGTEDSVLRVVRSADGTHLADEIPRTRACSVAWEPDGAGFCYTRYPEDDQYHRTVYRHVLGTPWHDDEIVWADHPTPETWPEVHVSPDGRHLLVTAMVGRSWYENHLLDRSTGRWHTLVAGVDARTEVVFGHDGDLYGITTLDAPNGRVIRIPLDRPPTDPSRWVTIVPERDIVVDSPRAAGEALVLKVTRRATDSVERWSLDGSTLETLDDLGVVSVDGLTADPVTGRTFVLTAGFASPASLWRVVEDTRDPYRHRRVERWHPPAPSPDDVPALTVTEVEYPSADGTAIGMFLVHRADLEPSPSTATILTGYGGFAITETPVWSPMAAAWCAAGGQYALAGLRGGLEHGDAWHRAGRRASKQNVFDDFCAAADWLVATGRTSRDRLAIAGGSNGGLLVGAALTQRSDLCRAVWCAVPLLDMVRFPQFLIARLWTDEYGDPEIAEEFTWLHAYSPYHHVTEGTCYPAVLLTTAEGDTRVDPLHARKMAALLQWASSCQDLRPILLHQEGRAGHGVGKPVGKRAAEAADVLTFLSWQLDAG